MAGSQSEMSDSDDEDVKVTDIDLEKCSRAALLLLSKHLMDIHRVQEEDLDNFEAEIKSFKEERTLLIQKAQDRLLSRS